ncbi:MAG TPA: hypothetical protein VJ124_00380 [Pyrinomonadaceae bacterium]|nr:hypothetical protein [Pyrinomonadaceae bacterium]
MTPQRAPAEDPFDVSPQLLKESFDGWVSGAGPSGHWHELQPLRTEEFMQVELVTVREGCTHRRWPPQVVMKFFVAEVIRPSRNRRPADHSYDDLPELRRVSSY